MTDINKLKELAELCLSPASGETASESANLDALRRVSFRKEANPQAILKLIDEVERLRIGLKGDFDLDAWLEWTREKDQIKAENEALRGALHAVQAEVDGNLRPLTRDLVNMVSGLNNGTHPNDIYEHCDEIERIIGAALEGATQ